MPARDVEEADDDPAAVGEEFEAVGVEGCFGDIRQAADGAGDEAEGTFGSGFMTLSLSATG